MESKNEVTGKGKVFQSSLYTNFVTRTFYSGILGKVMKTTNMSMTENTREFETHLRF